MKLALGLIEPKLVFVTAGTWQGDLGGAAGADAKCQQEADSAGVAGTFMAWLSTSGSSPASDFTRSPAPYVLSNGNRVADDWDDLTDGSLQNPINVELSGGTTSYQFAWTGTGADASAQIYTCSDWTAVGSSSNNLIGVVGQPGSTGTSWTRFESSLNCGLSSPLYCFQQ